MGNGQAANIVHGQSSHEAEVYTSDRCHLYQWWESSCTGYDLICPAVAVSNTHLLQSPAINTSICFPETSASCSDHVMPSINAAKYIPYACVSHCYTPVPGIPHTGGLTIMTYPRKFKSPTKLRQVTIYSQYIFH
jgi:hypothetical protein